MTIGAANQHLEVHGVAHTHWDREWYRPAVQFQQRLLSLIDAVLDDPADAPFLLDGQAVVLEDYLSLRPERAADLSARLRAGTIEAGPWYVLADELIPSAEALVRNLLAGGRVLRRLRGAPPAVLYCPDSFGHPAALPALATGFGCPVIVAWRGLGGARWPDANPVRWGAPDGSTALLYCLPRDGYGCGAHWPADEAEGRARWGRLREELVARSALGIVLLPQGADHHAPGPVGARPADVAPDQLLHSSLARFTDALVARAATRSLPVVHGELRDSYGWAWTLPGTLGARAALKRRNALVERLLLRDTEPWAALARLRDGRSRRAVLEQAWRPLLLCHPHDTLCGCAVDEVATAMAARLDEARSAAEGVRDDALDVLAGHDAVAARRRIGAWQPVVVVRNRAARPRGGVAEVALDAVVAEVPVGPGPTARPAVPAAPIPVSVGEPPAAWQELARERVFAREESPVHYPRTRLVERHTALVWMEPVPAYGLRCMPVRQERRRGRRPPRGVRAGPDWIANDHARVSVSAHGVSLAAGDRALADCLSIDGEGERGDLYTHSPIEGTRVRGRLLGARVTRRGPLRASITVRWQVELPARRLTSAAGTERLVAAARVPVTTVLTLDAGAPFLRITVRGENRTTDVRLRVRFRTDVTAPRVVADAAFGPVDRVPIEVPPGDAAVEAPSATAPLHRYVSLYDGARGCTVYSDGLAEYEAAPDGSVAVTLLRAVGELSRSDLPERPGHAGYPVPVPAAQSAGDFEAAFALFPHGPRHADTIALVEETADDVLLPLAGTTWRTAIDPPEETPGPELIGRGLAVSCIKETEDGAWTVLRCVNLLDEPVDGRWRAAFLREARMARLDERPVGDVPVSGGVVAFTAAPRAVVTLLVR
jgi:alpha-mannosidase